MKKLPWEIFIFTWAVSWSGTSVWRHRPRPRRVTRRSFSDSLWWFNCDIADNKHYQNQLISATCSWSCGYVGPVNQEIQSGGTHLYCLQPIGSKGALFTFTFVTSGCHAVLACGPLGLHSWTFGTCSYLCIDLIVESFKKKKKGENKLFGLNSTFIF